MKKHSKCKRKNQASPEYFIPMTKNQLQRKNFEESVHQWVRYKFLFVHMFNDSPTKKQQESESFFKNKCKQIQNQFLLKHKIEGLLSFFPLEYYETLIKYVMQKKLYWTFKTQDCPQLSSQNLHRNMEVYMVLQLKKYYKKYEYNQNYLFNTGPQKHVNLSEVRQSFNPNRASVRASFKKSNGDFLYELLMMFSVCVVAAFFQHFFPELEIDKIFRSEIYIIINHGFLDLEVSPSVYEIMQKKFRTRNNQRNFQSLNTSYIHEFSNSHSKGFEKHGNNPDSKRTIGDEKLKSTATIENHKLSKFMRTGSNQKEGTNINSGALNSLALKGLASVQFSSKFFNKPAIKKEFFIKPTTSIGYCLPSQPQYSTNGKRDFQSHPNFNVSRFNSFIKDTKQMSIPHALQEALDNGYLPTDEEIDFYSTIRNCLQVDTLPPIKKKKMNINQYQKLNEVDKIKEIRKEIRGIDQESKKNHIMSNDISLAMNTFISTSCEFPKKKRVQRDVHIVTEYLKNPKNEELIEIKQGRRSCMGSENKQNFQLRKLPLNSSTLKFQLTKSCNFYSFNDEVLNIGQVPKKQVVQVKSGKTFLPASSRKFNQSQKTQKNERFQQSNKKNSTEITQFNRLLKTPHIKNEIITLRQSDKKAQKKKKLEKKTYSRQRQSELISIGSNTGIERIGSFKQIESTNIIRGVKKRASKNSMEIQDNKIIHQRESIMNNFDLSSKMQKYELGTKQVTKIEVINQNTNRSENISRYGGLEGEVNVQKDISTNYKSLYKSFELKKKLKDFETNCKKREEISNYSVFNLHTFNELMVNGVKSVKEQDEEESKGRVSECMV